MARSRGRPAALQPRSGQPPMTSEGDRRTWTDASRRAWRIDRTIWGESGDTNLDRNGAKRSRATRQTACVGRTVIDATPDRLLETSPVLCRGREVGRQVGHGLDQRSKCPVGRRVDPVVRPQPVLSSRDETGSPQVGQVPRHRWLREPAGSREGDRRRLHRWPGDRESGVAFDRPMP